jgi:hypothetical protein
MCAERRSFERVQFGNGYNARIMGIDGTWQRECRIGDVSDTGAKLTIRGSVEGLNTEEFFLVLSTTGSAHRRCERVWLKGDEIGVRFLKEGLAKHKLEWTNAAGAAARFIEPTTSD